MVLAGGSFGGFESIAIIGDSLTIESLAVSEVLNSIISIKVVEVDLLRGSPFPLTFVLVGFIDFLGHTFSNNKRCCCWEYMVETKIINIQRMISDKYFWGRPRCPKL